MLVIFPFEEQFYRDRGVQAEFVGHPLADLPLPTISREALRRPTNSLDPSRTLGSASSPAPAPRRSRDNLPEMLRAATLARSPSACAEETPNLNSFSPLLPRSPPAQRQAVAELGRPDFAESLTVRLVDESPAPPSCTPAPPSSPAAPPPSKPPSSAIPSSSSTASPALTYAIAKRVVTVPHIAMANLIAGKRVVPELIQNDFTAAKIVEQLAPLLPDGEPRESMMQELRAIGGLLRKAGGP